MTKKILSPNTAGVVPRKPCGIGTCTKTFKPDGKSRANHISRFHPEVPKGVRGPEKFEHLVLERYTRSETVFRRYPLCCPLIYLM